MVSTEIPSTVRNRLNGITASLTAIGAVQSSVEPSPVARSSPSARSCCDGRAEHDPGGRLGQRGRGRLGDERHRTRGARVGLQDVQRVAGQGELDVDQAADADAAWRSPRSSVRIRSTTSAPRVIGGSAQAESPEWMPASSMCSITPPR